MWPTNGRGCIAKLHSIVTMLVASPEQDHIHGATHFPLLSIPSCFFLLFLSLSLPYSMFPYPFPFPTLPLSNPIDLSQYQKGA